MTDHPAAWLAFVVALVVGVGAALWVVFSAQGRR
jgi:hypothetical protein